MTNRQIICSYAGYRLVRVGERFHVECEADSTLSSPLHPTIVTAIRNHPQSLLDLQLLTPTQRPEDLPTATSSTGDA